MAVNVNAKDCCQWVLQDQRAGSVCAEMNVLVNGNLYAQYHTICILVKRSIILYQLMHLHAADYFM